MKTQPVPSDTFLRRLLKRSRRFLLPFIALDLAAAYFFFWHMSIQAHLLDSLERLSHYATRDSRAAYLEAALARGLAEATIVLLLALACSLLAILLLGFAGWSARCLRKHRRFAARRSLILFRGGSTASADLLDISRSGCRIGAVAPVPVGSVALLQIHPVGDCPARIAWTKSGMAGLAFVKPLEAGALRCVLRPHKDDAGQPI